MKFQPVTIKPSKGGRLMTGVSSDTAGIFNYTVKRDFRRVLDSEVLAEGYDRFAPNPSLPVMPDVGGAPISLIAEAQQQNGRKVVIAGSKTDLFAYALNDGVYVAVGYVADGYYADDTPNWTRIGSGFSPNGKRWEAENVNGFLVLNNGVDLPVTWQVGDAAVKPIYELREHGIASVGTISEKDGILMVHDLRQIKEQVLNEVLYPIPMDPATQSGMGVSFDVQAVADAAAAAIVTRATAALTVVQAEYDQAQAAQAAAETALKAAQDALAAVGNSDAIADIQTILNASPSDSSLQSAGLAALAAIRQSDSIGTASIEIQQQVDFATGVLTAAKADFQDATQALADAQGVLASAQLQPTDIIGLSAAILANPQILVGMRVLWKTGDVSVISTVNDGTINLAPPKVNFTPTQCVIENPLAYAAFTNDTQIDRYPSRNAWSMPSRPRRFGAIIPCSVAADDLTYLTIAYPSRSIDELMGSDFVVPGIGASGGNLTVTTKYVNGIRVYIETPVEYFETLNAAVGDAEAAVLSASSAISKANNDLISTKSALQSAQQALIDAIKAYPGDQAVLADAITADTAAQSDLVAKQQAYAAAQQALADYKATIAYDPTYWTTAQIQQVKALQLSLSNADVALYNSQNTATSTKQVLSAATVSASPDFNSIILAASDANAKVLSAQATLDAATKDLAANNTLLFTARAKAQESISSTMMELDASGSITAKFEDIDDDGSGILKAMSLRSYLVIYKETSIFLCQYTGNTDRPFVFEKVPIPDGTALYYRNCVALINGSYHIYAGRDKFYKFDLSYRVPMEMVQELQACQETFFKSVSAADIETVFCADNPLTNELFFCFPLNADGDAALRYDYRHGTTSTTSAAFTAAAYVRRPESQVQVGGAEEWFIMGDSTGNVLRYGRVSGKTITAGVNASRNGTTVTAAGNFFTPRMVGWSIVFKDKTLCAITGYTSATTVTVAGSGPVTAQPFVVIPAIYHRMGQPYTAVLQSGLEYFGAINSVKRTNLYEVFLASDSPQASLSFALRAAINSNEPDDRIADTIPAPLRHNMVPVLAQDYLLGDRISVTGINHLLEIVARVITVAGIDSRAFERA